MKMLIRLDADVSDEWSSAFPQLTTRHHSASTTLTGQLADQKELQRVLHLLNSLGLEVVAVLTIPED